MKKDKKIPFDVQFFSSPADLKNQSLKVYTPVPSEYAASTRNESSTPKGFQTSESDLGL